MAAQFPPQYDPGTIAIVLNNVCSDIDNYEAEKANLVALSGPLASAQISAGPTQFTVTDPGLLSQVQAGAAQLLQEVEANYKAELQALSDYIQAALAANQP